MPKEAHQIIGYHYKSEWCFCSPKVLQTKILKPEILL